MNEIKFSSYSKTSWQVFWEKICPHWTVWITEKSDACNVQSDLDLHCTQKAIMSHLAVKMLIHPKLKDVLSDVRWYNEGKKVTI